MEYWLRVVTVWLLLIGLGFIVVALLRIPTFVLVESQLRAFSGAYDEAIDKTAAFDEAQAVITEANELSRLLAEEEDQIPLTDMITILDGIAGSAVRINEFNFTRSDGTLTQINVTGVAATRVALADFSKDIEAHELFAEAELPISNLAKDQDIAFSISITLPEE